jgi:hypothetical protein
MVVAYVCVSPFRCLCMRLRTSIYLSVCVCARACMHECACPPVPVSWRPVLSQVWADYSLLWPLPAQNRPSVLSPLPCAAGQVGLQCNRILGLPAGPVPRPMPSAKPPAVQSAIPAVLPRPPQAAHTGLARGRPQLWQRTGVCARACACRWCCRSRRWPAGKLRDYQRQTRAVESCTRLCEVLRVLKVL